MIALIDYGMGNLLSVSKALEHVGANLEIVSSPNDVAKADALVVPGVGNFGDGMENLRSTGLLKPILEAIQIKKPYLGICLGMQMLLESSEEAPGVTGMGVIPGAVVRFPEIGMKIPHMGWNNISIKQSHTCLNDVPDESFFYFVHSFYAAPTNPEAVLVTCDYAVNFAAAIGGGNIFATQFHPEKSQEKGLKILENFVKSI